MEENKYLELAKKLKRLAEESSFKSERENAQRALDELMKKRGITKSELEQIEKDWHSFSFRMDEKELFIQTILSVVGANIRNIIKKTTADLEITKAEAVEIDIKFDVFRRLYKDERELFFATFCTKHRLHDMDAETEGEVEMTPERLQKIQRMRQMAMGMRDAEYVKQIEGGG